MAEILVLSVWSRDCTNIKYRTKYVALADGISILTKSLTTIFLETHNLNCGVILKSGRLQKIDVKVEE